MAITEAQLKVLVQEAMTAAMAASAAAATTATTTRFTLHPGDGVSTQPWDFTTGDGLKLFINGTKPIVPAFDGKQEGLHQFLFMVKERATTFGWDSILQVNDSQGEKRDITIEYGALTRAEVLAHATVYQARDQRERQAANCLLTMIKASISTELSTELQDLKDQYVVSVGTPAIERTDGVLYLFALISTVAIETKSTVANIIKQLNNMSTIMEKTQSDIKLFNTEVNLLLSGLRARNHSVPDIVTNLFEAYKSCEDSKFVEYMMRKEEAYEDNTISDLTAPKLMKMALEKFKTLQGRNQWKQKSSQELEFIALKNELLKVKKLEQDTPRKATPKKEGGPPRQPGRKNEGKWAWKAVAPGPNESKEKRMNGKDYVYCPHHGDTKWVLKTNRQGVPHATGCRAAASGSNSGSMTPVTLASTISSLTEMGTPDQLLLARALATVMAEAANGKLDQSEDDDDDESGMPAQK
jgi:hypothetical protein